MFAKRKLNLTRCDRENGNNSEMSTIRSTTTCVIWENLVHIATCVHHDIRRVLELASDTNRRWKCDQKKNRKCILALFFGIGVVHCDNSGVPLKANGHSKYELGNQNDKKKKILNVMYEIFQSNLMCDTHILQSWSNFQQIYEVRYGCSAGKEKKLKQNVSMLLVEH